MKILPIIAILTGLSLSSQAQEKSASPPESTPEFRKPFTLKLHIDEEHVYEEKFQKIPYVHKGSVYLFSGEDFGISFTITGDDIDSINYEKDPKKADVAFRFYQEVDENKKDSMMMCRITNNTNHKLYFDGLMTIPEKKAIFKTSIIPLEPKLTNYESWPHPIVQLVLRNIRLKDESPTDEGQTKTEQDSSGQPATRFESKPEGRDIPQPESEGRSR